MRFGDRALRTKPVPMGSSTSNHHDPVGLLEGIASTRAIRRYSDQQVTDDHLNTLIFAASRAPSGSNRQRFRFLILRDNDHSRPARELLAQGAQKLWGEKRVNDGYDRPGRPQNADVAGTPKSRMAATMSHYVENFATVPVIILPCLIRHRAPMSSEGGSVYPAVQNLLLAARAIGLGGALTGVHEFVDADLRPLLGIPDDVFIAATVTLGHPAGSHGPVRRRPIAEFVFEDRWDNHPTWPQDPPGTTFTSAGPPAPTASTEPVE